MSTLFTGPEYQALDGNGKPLSGGTVEFFEVGTSTPKDVYSDSSLATSLGSTVTLDADGRAKLWLNGDYKARLKTSDGTVVRTSDGINPPVETETSGGNLIANGSFEDAGNSSTEASGWTLTAQSDGKVERITADNFDGTAALKFTSDGSGGGQADTNSFFAVSPGRSYEVSFALKCSVADIRNIVQVRYFDKDQQFLSNSTVYDEDTSNPTSWEVQQLSETPPANARFAKLRILGADQSDATSGEAKFDGVRVAGSSLSSRFPNVDADVTATDEELNTLDGYTGSTADLNGVSGHASVLDAILDNYDQQEVELGGDFDSGQKVRCTRIGSIVTIVGKEGQSLSHTNGTSAGSSTGAIPSNFRPRSGAEYSNLYRLETSSDSSTGRWKRVRVGDDGTMTVAYLDNTGSTSAAMESSQAGDTLSGNDYPILNITYTV